MKIVCACVDQGKYWENSRFLKSHESRSFYFHVAAGDGKGSVEEADTIMFDALFAAGNGLGRIDADLFLRHLMLQEAIYKEQSMPIFYFLSYSFVARSDLQKVIL